MRNVKDWDIHPTVSQNIDTIDRRILAELQRDGTLSVDQLSDRVNLSRNACWRRVKRLEEDGGITLACRCSSSCAPRATIRIG